MKLNQLGSSVERLDPDPKSPLYFYFYATTGKDENYLIHIARNADGEILQNFTCWLTAGPFIQSLDTSEAE